MLLIGKPAEFDDNGYPVRGQCAPHTKGWRLRLRRKGQADEILAEDSYYVCRQLQLECIGLDESGLRAKVSAFLERNIDVLETQRMRLPEDASETDTADLGVRVEGDESAEPGTEILDAEDMARQLDRSERPE